MGQIPGSKPKAKTSERWKNIRSGIDELRDINEICRGMEIESFERDRIMRRVTQKEVLRMLLETEPALKYRAIAKANKPRAI